MSNNDSETLAAEILRGAQAIGDFVGLDVRKCFYGLERGHIPAIKEGTTWVSTKTRLRKHYHGEASNVAPLPDENVA
jgi:hypothetical protein